MTHEERRIRRESIARDVSEGGSIETVAIRYGVTIMTAKNACEQSGISAGKFDNFNYKVVAMLINTEYSLTEIAELANVTKQRIHQIYKKLKEFDIKMAERSKEAIGVIVLQTIDSQSSKISYNKVHERYHNLVRACNNKSLGMVDDAVKELAAVCGNFNPDRIGQTLQSPVGATELCVFWL